MTMIPVIGKDEVRIRSLECHVERIIKELTHIHETLQAILEVMDREVQKRG